MTTQQNRKNLSNGPSKFELMLALFDKDRGVTFVGDDGTKYIASIHLVQAEDGSKESWNLKGSTKIEPRGCPAGCGGTSRHYFNGYFRTDSRKGSLVLV